jgi:hypothetical protein
MRSRLGALLATLALCANRADGADPTVATDPAAVAAPCRTYARTAVRVGAEPAELAENSGLVASRKHSGIFWAHNDSGNAFELFAQRIDGSIAARVKLTGGDAFDIEDIALGPCLEERAASCIFLADIGDNQAKRKQVVVYQVAEPARLENGTLAARKLPFTYPDKPHNAEALIVSPRDGHLFVITKEGSSLGTVFRLDGLAPGKVGRALEVRRLAPVGAFSALTTAADVHPSGLRVLLRTYTGVFEYRGREGQGIEDILGEVALPVTAAPQPQPEAIAYTADGRGYLLGSEIPSSAIYRVDCAE